MKHILTKTSHERHHLDGKELESKSYLPHDLMHFAYANVTQSNEGFFAEGENVMREEAIVGVLQGGYKEFMLKGEEFDLEDFILQLNEYLAVSSYEASDLTPLSLRKVFDEYQYLFRRWQHMRTGESLQIDVVRGET